ncbi:hypothetical protein E8E13_004068 [Curvularia kusanoi]|uniref:Heterokaryon incompatibility domain-containing protein n=1 Tax=Curvularia kusanoi TaxID=90978 RepID=A0A9P4T7Y5_CURKU|nr:hypothetical protein E8E13_004068 [Curvularia kusanoi]
MEQAALQVPADQAKDTIAELYAAHPLSLDASKNIRLLTKAPSTTANPQDIEFDINVISLSDNPEYTALSYVWGTDEPNQIIRINGEAFPVRKNLFDFLQEYWRRDRSDALWIDAICINQTSIPERNHQVAMMGDIYLQASLVISWLGAESELVKAFGQLFDCEKRDLKDLTKVYGPVLCDAEYWHRAWITQEFSLPKNIEIWCGIETRSFESIRSRAVFIGKKSPRPGDDQQRMFYLASLRTGYQRSLWDGYSLQTFLILLGQGLRTRCSDVRDRIYSLLALFNPEELKKHPIVVDYGLSPTETFLALQAAYGGWMGAIATVRLARLLEIHEDPLVEQYVKDHSNTE